MAARATPSLAVRSELIEALQLDLVGPDNEHAFAHELLPDAPSHWYLNGFLIPRDAPPEQRSDETATEEIDSGGDARGTDDATEPDRGAARRRFFPSSMGLTVLVPSTVDTLEARACWGDYTWQEPEGGPKGYRREPRTGSVVLPIPAPGERPREHELPGSGGLAFLISARPVSASRRLPAGTRAVSVFLVNQRQPEAEHAYRAWVFQARLTLSAAEPFVARPDLRGSVPSAADEWDAQVADLHYRDVCEFAVGHGASAAADRAENGVCRAVRSCWLPRAEVERVAPTAMPGVTLDMETLGALSSYAGAHAALIPLVTQYRAWTVAQEGKLSGLEPAQQNTARDLIASARLAATRIEAGIVALADAQVLEAFRIANCTMAAAARRREAVTSGLEPRKVPAPAWYPFQLAFLLLTLRGIAEPLHDERRLVDLLFFPTGGGKTEAYLGLAAFTLVLRRLRHPGIRSAGVSVLMRYTLRLLTLDQLGRAAGLICALELERERHRALLGDWPFEIGLWVGSAATPNRLGRSGYQGPGAEHTAYRRLRRHRTNAGRSDAPIPIENCPWCGQKFIPDCFRLVPGERDPLNLEVRCANHVCEFSRDRPLPIIAVDEAIYRRLPGFLIATVDKFAALPWTGETGTLFGRVERYDGAGFYGPCKPGVGGSLGGPLPGPDLVIQDELHLISGPLGTVAGIYETVIDALAARQAGEGEILPKIVASTATVRRASNQIRALFGRMQVAVFPPPGPDRDDSCFARVQPACEQPARCYVGVAAPGRSLKVILLRVSLALLGAAQTAYEREGGRRNADNPADPYMTLLGYFNSLRELGGSRRIVEDEVRMRLAQYGQRQRIEPRDGLFADRSIGYDVLELTSRVSTDQVAAAKRRLALAFGRDECVDVALATNMISVGLDISRLGLMVVLGQPKTSAEYIQSTSRVGRRPEKPGLVVTLLNVHKPRDRSHYERFETYHASFYRAVEPTSVTPFSPRALDRALAAALVALCRQGDARMTPALGAEEIRNLRARLDELCETFAERARNHDARLSAAEADRLRDHVRDRCRRLLDDWQNIADEFRTRNARLQYQKWEERGPQRLLYDMLDPELPRIHDARRKFRANRSMRDVEPTVEMKVRNLNDWTGDR